MLVSARNLVKTYRMGEEIVRALDTALVESTSAGITTS